MHVDDVPDVLKIEQNSDLSPWTEQNIRDCLAHDNYRCWVMRLKYEIIGFGIINVPSIECHIMNLAIKTIYRQQGYGKQLLHYMLDDIRNTQVQYAILEVRQTNHQAIKLYKSFDFQHIGVRKNYYTIGTQRYDADVYRLDFHVTTTH